MVVTQETVSALHRGEVIRVNLNQPKEESKWERLALAWS